MTKTKGMGVRLDLEGLDGNAFAVLAAFQRAANRQGFDKEAIDAVMKEAQSGDYDNLLRVIIANTD